MENNRFFRIRLLLGDGHFDRLRSSKVIILGIGAVGYFSAEVLIRSGIGSIALVDCDIIEESDFNRHILATEENLGKSKVESAIKRLKSINPEAEIIGKQIFFHRDTISEIFSESYDFLIDAIDSLSPKLELIKYCLNNNQPFISTMGAARRTDPSMVRLSTINQGKGCPLLRLIKRRLRKEGIYNDFPIVYSEQSLIGTVLRGKDMYYKRGRIRDILPSSIFGTAVFGIYAAYYAIEFLNPNSVKIK